MSFKKSYVLCRQATAGLSIVDIDDSCYFIGWRSLINVFVVMPCANR
jgi:hypothetical protein